MTFKLDIFKDKVFISKKELRSDSDNGSYIRFVEKASRNAKLFSNFKKNKDYRQILEHTTADQGRDYLSLIAKQSPEILNGIQKFSINDEIGGSEIVKYSDICELSPSTLRYIKVASDLSCLFGDALQDAHVAEIGVGYGGQRLILDQIYRSYSYDMFDLPPVLNLVSKYLESHLLTSSYVVKTLNSHNGLKDYDLVISNYAFSELPSSVQIMYLKKVLKKSKRGYLTMNSGLPDSIFSKGKLSLEYLLSELPGSTVLEERPHSAKGNYLLVWGQTGLL